jgi:hypothetical protein
VGVAGCRSRNPACKRRPGSSAESRGVLDPRVREDDKRLYEPPRSRPLEVGPGRGRRQNVLYFQDAHPRARDPDLKRFRTSLRAIYGERLERAVLFGSRLRGDARPDSDYDVAVFCATWATGSRRWIDSPPQLRYSRRDGRVHSRQPCPSRRLLRRAHAADARNPHGRHRFMKARERRVFNWAYRVSSGHHCRIM